MTVPDDMPEVNDRLSARAAASGADEERGRCRVLIVDDDVSVRAMLRLALSAEGFDVIEASNGLRLIGSLQVDHPDLVLLDADIGWISCFDLCRSIKQSSDLSDIAVILLSASCAESDVRRGMDAGADDYFVKPLDLDVLVRRIDALTLPSSE